jgi:hypothetical protein
MRGESLSAASRWAATARCSSARGGGPSAQSACSRRRYGLSAGQTAPGAFDDAQDYARNDVFELRPPHPLWIDLGASDPFHDAALAYARRAGVRAHVSPGGHDVAFWDMHTPQFLRFFARACA